MTYAQIVRTEKGYFLFTRERWNDKLENGKKESHWCWLVSFSRDGENWKDPCRLIDSGKHQYYLKAVSCTDSTDIRLIMYAHPNLNSSAIRQAFFNIDTWEVSSTKGKVLGKAEAAAWAWTQNGSQDSGAKSGTKAGSGCWKNGKRAGVDFVCRI